MSLEQALRDLGECGWAVIDLPDPNPVLRAREHLLDRLRRRLPELADLAEYHRHVSGEDLHIEAMFDLCQFYWDEQIPELIVAANIGLLRAIAGPDLDVQRRPFLRAVRPDHPEDAVPLHRDTLYGASPHEVSILVPFTDMPAESALLAIAGSHLEPESAYPFTQTTSASVTKGSPRHKLGYAYAPRLLSPTASARAQPVPLAVGQVMVFGLSLVHGGGTNQATHTRFSSDFRVVNPFVPLRRNRGVDEQYFVPLCRSPIGRSAETFLTASAAEGTEPGGNTQA